MRNFGVSSIRLNKFNRLELKKMRDLLGLLYCLFRSPKFWCRGGQTPSSVSLPPDPAKFSLPTEQGRGQVMDCPLTNQGPYTFFFRIGAKCKQSSQTNLSKSLSSNHSLCSPVCIAWLCVIRSAFVVNARLHWSFLDVHVAV